MLFHCNSGYANAPQYYVYAYYTMPVLFNVSKYRECTRVAALSRRIVQVSRARSKRDGTRAEPDLVFQRNLNWRWRGGGGPFQLTTGSRGVRISGSNGSNAGYTMFWGTVQDFWLRTPLACFPFTSPTVRHRVPSGFNWALQRLTRCLPYVGGWETNQTAAKLSVLQDVISELCFLFVRCSVNMRVWWRNGDSVTSLRS